MTDVSTDTGPLPVFGPDGKMMGNQTSNQGQPPAALAPQSPLSNMGPPPAPTPPPQYPALNTPPIPRQPTQQQLGPSPDAKEYEKNSMAFASAMAVLGAVASKFTRVSGTAALSAFSGALNGWKQGNLEMYESAAKKWEQDTKATLDNNRQIMEQYRLALENRKMNIDEQMSQIQLVSAQYHDKMMYDAAASKNYTLVAQIYEKNFQYTEKAQEAAAKLQERRDEQKTKNEQSATYWLSPEGQARLPTLTLPQQAGIKQMIELYGQKAAKGGLPGQLIAKENQERQDRGEAPMTAQEEITFSQQIRPPRSAPAMALQKFIQTHPGADEKAITQFSATYNEAQSRARTLGTRGGNVDVAVTEAVGAAKQAIQRSAEVPRGEFVPINQLQQATQRAGSSPALQRFKIANASLITAYAQTMSRTGQNTVTAQNRATEVLSTATGPEAYKAGVEQLMTEMQIVQQAVKDVAGGQGGGESPAAPAGGATPKSGDVIKYDANGERVQ